MAEENLSLLPGNHHTLQVLPRWPYKKVVTSRDAFARLQQAQEQLGGVAQLIITRGFEPGNFLIRRLHSFMRVIGSLVFMICYPTRVSEISEIFSANGHDQNGNHVDLAISQNGEILKLLPMGVLTPPSALMAIEDRYAEVLALVRNSLMEVGFEIHSNRTEALQIHCDLKSLDSWTRRGSGTA